MNKNIIKYIPIFLVPLCISLMGCDNRRKIDFDSAQDNDADEYMVVGYVAGYRDFDFSTIQADKLTHINYAFANVIDGEVHFDTTEIDNTELKASDIEALHALKEKNPALQILVSVGGWVWSGNFSDCALTEKTRQKFARSAAAFVKKYRLDGIDIDWEYPNQVGAGNVHRVEDIQNFTLLMKSVREHLDSLANNENSGHLLLTIATGADSAYLANTRLDEVSKYLDFLNIMSYDLYHGNDRVSGHHSNLYPSKHPGPKDISVSKSVEMHLAAGVPRKKINLGIPFYGRKWEGVKSGAFNGLHQDAGSTGQIIYYRTFAPTCIDTNGYHSFWDDAAKAPILWNPDSAIFISYENAQSISHKMAFVKEMGLGGVMFWEYSDDFESQLLNAIHQGLNK